MSGPTRPPGRQTNPSGTWITAEPPEIQREETFLDRWMPLVERQHKKTIRSLAAQALSVTGDLDESIVFGMFGFGERKPLWWDTRLTRIPAAQAKPPLVQKVYLLRRDLQEYFYWDDRKDTFLGAWLEDKRSQEKRGRVEEIAGYMQYARFSAHDLATDVFRLAEE